MTALFPQNTPAPAGVPQGIREVFDKGKWWRQADGTWIKVKHMSPAHRANAARMLMRDADAFARRYTWAGDRYLHDAPDEVWAEYENESDRIMADPEKWMRGTKLYRRLTEKSRPDLMNEFERAVVDAARELGEYVTLIDTNENEVPEWEPFRRAVEALKRHEQALKAIFPGPECTCKQASDMGHDVECPRADWARGNR